MRTLMHSIGLAALAALLLTPPAPAYTAQDEDKDKAKDEAKDEAKDAEKDATEEPEEEADSWFAVTGADVYTGTGSVLRGATVLAKNGKIEDIGYDLWMPDDVEVLDASGYRVYPGLVAVSTSGLFGGSSDLENTVNPFNRNMVLALASGITTGFTGDQVAKLKYGEIEGVVLGKGAFKTFSFNKSNPSSKRSTREKFEAAAKYLRGYKQWEIDKKADKDLKEPSKKGIDQAYLQVLRGEIRPTFSATERTDLLEIARLSQRFGFRPIIRGCREGWVVADELGRAGASVILTARDRRPKDERFVRQGGSSIENAALLHKAGVSVTIISASTGISLGGTVGRDLMALTIEAGFAIRGGLPESAALAGITIEPARLMGVGHRVGTLEIGKDADLLVTDGDLLHYQTFVQWAIVDGKIAYDKQNELFFAHIRPRPESELAPEERLDAGETAPEEEAEEEGDGEEEGEGDDGEGGDGEGGDEDGR